MTANLTRRRMLAAAGIGTAAAAFTGAASAQCRNDVKWDETHEIVVVGAGGAGMAAAVKAAQTGAKDILVLEKLAFTGGNTLIAQGFINAADPVRQPRQGHQGLARSKRRTASHPRLYFAATAVAEASSPRI